MGKTSWPYIKLTVHQHSALVRSFFIGVINHVPILIADNDDLTVELEPESWPTDKVADPDPELDKKVWIWILF